MTFDFLDEICERGDDRIVTTRHVRADESYLNDHFPAFPVLPGVLMLETMAQAARALLAPRGDDRLVLGEVRNLKYGAMVRPGDTLRVEITLDRTNEDGSYGCRGRGTVLRGADPPEGDPQTAVRGRFTMRPIRLSA